MDTTFRDGHQSSLATRLRTDDILPVAEKVDRIGYEAFEIWGGATFDVAQRFLGEDPWERVIKLKKMMPNTPFQMLLRGQNVVGYRNFADDVVDAFCKQAVTVGVDRFRVFDALNDERNFEAAFKALSDAGGHIQGTICYALTERKIGGEVYNLEYFKTKAKTIESMGAHSLCVKDMAGLISPDDAYKLISELKATISIPIQLHTHYTSGMGSMSYLKAVEAGVDIIDCALSPFALRSSQPAVGPIVVALMGSDRDTGMNLESLSEIGEYIESIAPRYRDFLDSSKMSIIDTGVLLHQVPGGMQSNFINQLKQADALDRLNEVHKELPQTRKDLGNPPLVTPSSQIIGVQAVMNVLQGRYKVVSDQVKDYCYGLYGTPPQPIDPEVRKIVLKGYPKGETPIEGRPGDYLDPEMPAATEAVKELLKPAGITDPDIGDVILYAMFKRTGKKFLLWKHGLSDTKPGETLKTMKQIEEENDLFKKVRTGEITSRTVEKAEKFDQAGGEPVAPIYGTRVFSVAVEDERFSVVVADEGGLPEVTEVVQTTKAAPTIKPKPKPVPKPVSAPIQKTVPVNQTVPPADGTAVVSPMPGTIISYPVKVGDSVQEGDSVVVLEAMKMENAVPAPVTGTVKSLGPDAGSNVRKGETLVVIG